MLEVAPGGTAPGGDEAQRVLSFFLSRCVQRSQAGAFSMHVARILLSEAQCCPE